jgi:hypothetical protein
LLSSTYFEIPLAMWTKAPAITSSATLVTRGLLERKNVERLGVVFDIRLDGVISTESGSSRIHPKG